MKRSWAISLTLASVMLAATFVWAKEPGRKPHRDRENSQHNPANGARPSMPRLPGAVRNPAAPRHEPRIDRQQINAPRIGEPKVNEPRIAEPKIVEPKIAEPQPGGGGDPQSGRVNDPRLNAPGFPRAGDAPRPHPGEGLSRLKDMPMAEQQKALNNDPDFQKLPPEQKESLRRRLEEFNKLPPQQKQQLIERMRVWGTLTSAQKEQARGLQQRLQAVPDDRQKMMRTALRSLRQMDPEERERVMNSERFKGMFNDNEREIMRGIADLPIKPAEAPQPAPETQPK